MVKLCLGNNVMLLITEYKPTQKGHSGDAEKLFEWPNTQQKLLLVAAFCSKKDIGTLLEGFFDQQEWKCI